MITARDIVWVPVALCERLSAELQALLDDWARAWGLPGADRLHAHALDTGNPALPSEVIDLLAPASAAWRDALSLALLEVRCHSPIAHGVVRRVVNSLHEALQTAFGTAPRASTATVGATAPGHHGLVLRVQLLGLPCGVALTNEQLRQSGRLTRPPKPALPAVPFERAMAAAPVPLVAQVGHASLSARELLELAPGDVLVLAQRLSSPLSLVSPGSPLCLTAHLGATADATRRAARCLAPH